jgi:preprotein translocase subunit SecA
VFGIIDEATAAAMTRRTPVILSALGDRNTQRAPCEVALRIAARLEEGTHFGLEPAYRRVRFTDAGRDAVDDHADLARDVSPFASAREAEESVERAVAALHLYARDQHYVVIDGKVQIVDEFTGRIMPDRSWERGLHQMIEAKEECALSARRETLARITYQRLFRRYLRLAGER